MDDGARLLLALGAYRAAQGRLPEALEALVPEYIDEVPRDPVDGRELGYCPEAGLFYSIGDDLADGGGGPSPHFGPEPTFRLRPTADER
jgi:hypothetical protein